MVRATFTSSMASDELAGYVSRQLDHLFPDGASTRPALRRHVDAALERLAHCLGSIRMKYYRQGTSVNFSHLHTDHYASFLYLFSHMAYRAGETALAAKLYALNKALHGLDVFYEVELPDIFLFQHPVGTVLGRATYGNYLFVAQRCTVGSNIRHRYPTLGEGVVLCSGSAIIGDCTVGHNCWMSAGAQLMDMDVPSDMVVFGQSPNVVIKPTKRHALHEVFGQPRAYQEAR